MPLKKPQLELEQLNEHERVLKRPGMFMGALEAVLRKYRVLNIALLKNKILEFKASDGLERTFIEALSNSGDNVSRSRQFRVDPGYIEVVVSKRKVRIYNTGKTFDIKKFKKSDTYQQEIAFGVLGSSTNYNDALREDVGGLNGVGIKLTNIYSSKFEIKIGDSKSKQLYTQVWTNNMFTRNEPVISAYDGESFVQVEYGIDFDRFDPLYQDGYDQNILNLFAFHCANLSFTHKIPVYFKGNFGLEDGLIDNMRTPSLDNTPSSEGRGKIKMEYGNIMAYLKLIHNTDSFDHNYLMYVSNGASNYRVGHNEIVSVPNQKIEVIIYDTPDKGEVISFVNGIITREDGVHVDAIFNKLKDFILTDLNKSKENKYKLTLRDLKPHISMVISCFLKEPKFKGQSKDHLSAPTPNIRLKEKDLAPMKEWKLIECLESAVGARMNRILAKTDGKKKRRIKMENVKDAAKAGTKESYKCVLYVTEGDSAKNYALRMFKYLNGGKGVGPYHGAFPLKGKPLNVMRIDTSSPEGVEKLNDNKEYTGLKEMLGLKEGMMFKSLDDIKKHCSYGSMVILADSDVDGKHIVGLTLTIFLERFKSLLELGFVKMHRTPVVRAFKGKKYRGFFTMQSFKKWLHRQPKGWRFKYCKGLASSNEKEIKMDVEENHIENVSTINLKYTPDSDRAMYIAFGDDTQLRKEWLDTFGEYEGIETIKDLTIEDFINKEMIEHAITNTARTIPGMDGLKESQRKVLYTALEKWSEKDSLKSGDLVNRSVNFTKYHYGPKSLADALNKMALDYPGSNNMAYFEQDGLFGTRLENGEDGGAERYTSVGKMWWWPLIFRTDDKIIYKYVEEEGKQCEPETLWPILPMFLINGAWGVGTAYSTFIPNYNPLDVCMYLKNIINKTTPSKIIPWYRGFKGSIKVTIQVKKNKEAKGVTKNILEPDVVDYDAGDQKRMRMVTKGMIEYDKEHLIITELPIGDSVKKYKKFLENEIEEGRLKDYEDNCENENIHIKLIGYKMPSQKKPNLIYRKLKLIRHFGMTNMVILNAENKPHCFRSLEEIMSYWYSWRLQGYVERIKRVILAYKEQLKTLQDKITFIEAVLLGYDLKEKIAGKTILVAKESDQSIQEQMEALKLDMNIYRNTSLSGISREGIKKAKSKYEQLEAEIESLTKTTPEQLWLKELDEFVVEYMKSKDLTPEKKSINKKRRVQTKNKKNE